MIFNFLICMTQVTKHLVSAAIGTIENLHSFFNFNMSCDIGVYGLGVMGTNLALNIASKGFNVAASNRSLEKVEMDFLFDIQVDECEKRSHEEHLNDKVFTYRSVSFLDYILFVA